MSIEGCGVSTFDITEPPHCCKISIGVDMHTSMFFSKQQEGCCHAAQAGAEHAASSDGRGSVSS